MSANPLATPGGLLRNLLDQWKKQFPKRASGGWWALAGFAIQTNVYLLRFFKRLESHGEPKLAAEMEHLSDIMCPADGKFILIQVKRTLTRVALIAAVEEAYLITDLCRRETPALLSYLRFQITCQMRRTELTLEDLSLSDVIKFNGDQSSWDDMLNCFDQDAPIVEEPDLNDQLRTFLWNVGIKNTGNLIERCAGRLLLSFGITEPDEVGQIAYDLADYYFGAERHSAWEPVGRILTAVDIESDPKTAEYSGVLTGQQPQLQHLTKGFFRDRPDIFQHLWQAFTTWLLKISTSEVVAQEKIQVFWIGGRSGEGKSVLLLQLIAEVLRCGSASPLLYLKGGDELPRLFATVPEAAHLFDYGFGHVFVGVDDIYDLHKHERDEWDATVLNECDYRIPPVAIITCGPTEQREEFAARLSGTFEVTHFGVPSLSMEEFHAFISWFKSRTGQEREFGELTTDNPLLVQLIFELARGERIPEFARRFKKRLIDCGLFEAARSVLAMNALYMAAPVGLVTTDESRDALEFLCKAEQLHFRVISLDDTIGSAGVRLAHPHLAWLLFIEWADTAPTPLAKAWARELNKSLKILEGLTGALSAGNLLSQLLNTTRLVNGGSSDPSSAAHRHELIRELYRLNVIDHGGYPLLRTLPRWLDLAYKLSDLQLDPDPAEYAVTCCSDDTLAQSMHGSVGIWIWLISEFRSPDLAEKIRSAAQEFFLNYPDNSGVGKALARLFSRARHDQTVNQFLLRWVDNNCAKAQALHVLGPLVASSPKNDHLKKLSMDWLEANQDHPHAYHLFAPLVAAQPDDADARQLAIDWLEANQDHRNAYQLLAPLVTAQPDDVKARQLAINWLKANQGCAYAYNLLAPLVAAQPDDADARQLAIDWLEANQDHRNAYQLLAPLVTAQPDDIEARQLALRWFDANKNHRKAYWLLTAVVAKNPNDAEVMKRAADWLRGNENHSHYYVLLSAMIARTDGAPEWLDRGERYVKDLKKIHREVVLRVLLSGGKADPRFIELGFDFLDETTLKSHRTAVLDSLKGALVYNYNNTIRYLNGPYNASRKRVVCTSIAVGMNRFPDTISAFALAVVPQLNPAHLRQILWDIVKRGLEVDYLDEMIAQWLIDNYRRPGYGSLLRVLAINIGFWNRLTSHGFITRNIVKDFQVALKSAI